MPGVLGCSGLGVRGVLRDLDVFFVFGGAFCCFFELLVVCFCVFRVGGFWCRVYVLTAGRV